MTAIPSLLPFGFMSHRFQLGVAVRMARMDLRARNPAVDRGKKGAGTYV